jgi:hypothetical protein
MQGLQLALLPAVFSWSCYAVQQMHWLDESWHLARNRAAPAAASSNEQWQLSREL